MFDNLAVVEPIDLHAGHAGGLRRQRDQDVSRDHVALSDHPFDGDSQLGKLAGKAGCHLDKGRRAIGRLGIVLNILGPDILCHRIRRLLLIEGAGDEVDYGLFVVIQGSH